MTMFLYSGIVLIVSVISVCDEIYFVPNARNAAALVSRTRLDPGFRRTDRVGRAARAHGGVW